MDGFDEDEAKCKGDDRGKVSCRLLAAERDALEAFELANCLLDAGAGPVERLREERGPVPLIRLVGITGAMLRSRAAVRLPVLA
jgi:hypothetical protein